MKENYDRWLSSDVDFDEWWGRPFMEDPPDEDEYPPPLVASTSDRTTKKKETHSMTTTHKVTVLWYDKDDIEHNVTGRVTFGDFEGDPTVPNGRHYLAPYVDDITLDGELVDNDTFDFESLLLERALELETKEDIAADIAVDRQRDLEADRKAER